MERSPQTAVVLTYGDPDLDFTHLRPANRLLQPIFAGFDQLRGQVQFTNLDFRQRHTGRLTTPTFVELLQSTQDNTKLAHATIDQIDRVRKGIRPEHLTSQSPLEDTPLAKSARTITLSPNVTTGDILDNIDYLVHDLKPSLTAVVGLTALDLRSLVRQGIASNVTHIEKALSRADRFVGNWEMLIAGELPKGPIPISEVIDEVRSNISVNTLRWLQRNPNLSQEKVKQRLDSILHIVELPAELKELDILYFTPELRRLMLNIGTNLLDAMTRKGGTGDDFFIGVTYSYEETSGMLGVRIDDNLLGLDKSMWVPGEGYRFRKGVGINPGGKHIGMSGRVAALEYLGGNYTLENNGMGGATQIYRFPTG